MSHIRYSVIVPAYNAKQTLLDTLQSATNVNRDDVEIIVVNDGSTDGSDLLIQDFINCNHSQTQVHGINQSNAGVSAARNTAIREARGDFLVFLDADDVLHDDFFVRLDDVLDTDPHTIDIVEIDHWRFFGVNTVQPVLPEKAVQYAITARESFERHEWYPWGRVIRRALFTVNPFPVGRYYEDFMAIPLTYLNARKILRLPYPLYGYRISPEGITENLKPDFVKDLAEYLVWLFPLQHPLLDLHKIMTLKLMTTLAIMMNDDQHKAFIISAKKLVARHWVVTSQLQTWFFWHFQTLYTAFIRLRSNKNKIRKTFMKLNAAVRGNSL